MVVSSRVEKARRRGVPEVWIEKHKYERHDGMAVRNLFDPFVKKGETVKLNEVTEISYLLFRHRAGQKLGILRP